MPKQCFVCGKELGWTTAKAITKDHKYLCPEDVNKLFMTDKANKLGIPMKMAFKISGLTSEEIVKQLNGEEVANEKEQQGVLCCPYCGSEKVTPLGVDKKNFSVGKAAAGAILTGGVGLLAGFAGKKTGKTNFVCMNCGKQFQK